MKRFCRLSLLSFLPALFVLSGCDAQVNQAKKNMPASIAKSGVNYKEGNDYFLFDRVRVLDKTAFSTPVEAYSILLPKGWQQQSQMIWNQPGSGCEGTFQWLKATSADGNSSIEMLPDIIFGWDTDPQMQQFRQNNPGGSPMCGTAQPMNAENYLRTVFGPNELGNPEIIKVEANQFVVEQMQQSNEKARTELMQYGSAQIRFFQTAINATVRWKNGTEGMVVLGATILENTIPNVYNGSSNMIYSTQITKRTVFTYPAAQHQQAQHQFSAIMGSYRTNPAYTNAVQTFWKDYRQKRQVAHIGKIQMMDAQTRAIGERAIANGQARLNSMDTEARSWEQRQASQDKVHTNFIKFIRGVENYRDETGKIELASGYDHAWSRSDGSSFIMSNKTGFDPSSVFQDQRWKEMKKVD